MAVDAADDAPSLLDVLRDQIGIRSAKDGCSPQGQCGCCTVLVDGSPRVACVTPVRRLDGREVTTLEGLPPAVRHRWAEALLACGGSQCGFCTPGIVMRLAALEQGTTDERIGRALLAHLCRCTGWQTVVEAARMVLGPPRAPGAPLGVTGAENDSGELRSGTVAARDLGMAAERATLEGGVPQRVGPEVVLGRAPFADDTSPEGALVAVPGPTGGYVVGESAGVARARAGKVQGRSTGLPLVYPVALPPRPGVGSWALTLQTTYVEPAYLEPDASWCAPGGVPASPCANGGAFGGKLGSPVAADARRLADEHRRPVRVLWSREDVVRRAPKRPPVAGAVDGSGAGVLRVGLHKGWADDRGWEAVVEAVKSVAPGILLQPVALDGPPVSLQLRGAVWVEAAVLEVCAPHASRRSDARTDLPVTVRAPGGGWADATCRADGSIEVAVEAGPALDEVVLRSYCIGAAHQALGWVRSEGIATDASGTACDLTIRSFGIVEARSMPHVDVRVKAGDAGSRPVNGSDAVFAAVAAAAWLAEGLPAEWPTHRGAGSR